jgi:predicted nucleic acid-binding protein
VLQSFAPTVTVATKVVDASALAAVLFNEAESSAVAGRLADAQLVAPHMLSFELTNICRTKIRQRPAERAAFLTAFAMRHSFNVKEMPVHPDAVLHLALATNLTVYDASYLWLARHLDAELVTLDKALARAAIPH